MRRWSRREYWRRISLPIRARFVKTWSARRSVHIKTLGPPSQALSLADSHQLLGPKSLPGHDPRTRHRERSRFFATFVSQIYQKNASRANCSHQDARTTAMIFEASSFRDHNARLATVPNEALVSGTGILPLTRLSFIEKTASPAICSLQNAWTTVSSVELGVQQMTFGANIPAVLRSQRVSVIGKRLLHSLEYKRRWI